VSKDITIAYTASPTLEQFHAGKDFIRIVRGPAGSGKSVGCMMETLRLAMEQRPQRDGIRRARTIVLRNTYPELLNTTIRTFKSWWPPHLLEVKATVPITGMLRIPGQCEIEYLFMSFDRDDRDRQIKSFEATNAYLNEIVELPKSALDAVTRAVGRYPRELDGGAVNPCVIADTNSCDIDHWLYHMAEKQKPRDFRVYVQPGAVIQIGKDREGKAIWVRNPKAENIPFLPGGYDYYRRMMVGKKDNWIRVFVANEYGNVLQGRPCHGSFSDRHVRNKIEPLRGIGLRLGWDYGRTPACIIFQIAPNGQRRLLREIILDPRSEQGMALKTFVDQRVRPVLETDFMGMSVVQSTGDPAGSSGGQAVEQSCEDILAEFGIPTLPAPTNNIEARLQAVDTLLDTNVDTGEPMLLISAEGCPMALMGFRGKYQMERETIPNREGMFKEKPVKNPYSHIMDAIQYAALGAKAETLTNSLYAQAIAQPVQSPRRWGT
jgi:hypothetical protein